MPKFTYDPQAHTYKLGDNRLISVTEVLPYRYMKDNQYAKDKGTYVHTACRLYLLNDLDEENLDPELVPYLDALKKFLHESNGMGIVGCFDIKSGSPHPCTELQIPAYIELANKGIPQNPANAPLLGVSKMILEEPFYHPIYQYCGTPDIIISDGGKVKEGHALYLKDNGKYSLSPVKDIRKNFEIFLSHLNAYKWQKEKGLI